MRAGDVAGPGGEVHGGGHGLGECPVAERLWFTEHVNIPCHPGLSDAQVDYLCEALDESLSALAA
ncbi:hypothetical protein [Streptomyces alanosinicus]|uniref:DegT/DnrJ/EryC1/StrS aminotransferase n=1 Tax=Streptomyces alanosinicus TaxID=68171 RepID=A0A919D6U3_9ACTN|nr:hypothetical protein [Streptomyces alanosinicus]GHE12868.1 hypothetical protein GCM10010339_77970 [Streptomyces alanosinicus]